MTVKKYHVKSQRGFVLATAMIFLVVMTLMAVTSIKRATIEEKVSANLREQNLAFQSAEAGLRYCQRELQLSGEDGKTLPLQNGVTKTINDAIPIVPYPADNTATSPPPMPSKWQNKADWDASNSKELTNTLIPGAAEVPKCMIEEWPFYDPEKGTVRMTYLITVRAVGRNSASVVWLQATIRPGTTDGSGKTS